MKTLPDHLRKYIVDQGNLKYTPKEHAIWRYILRQLKNFLKDHAHESYLDGLKKTGISSEEIPQISQISRHLEAFGWRALPVSGFIPPAAFMELQSLSVLPIASEIRSLDHLKYTPAPDIVHEAAGHAPFLAHPEFAEYLKKYSTVAKKAIISKEDLDIYEAIRVLSDVKENPTSTKEHIVDAENALAHVVAKNKTVSEAAELGRMNWWTAEYGLIGDIENPKIFGAGLLSSVGESKACLEPKVKKIPLSIDCLKYSYDITEQQPQLFVTPNFKHLEMVLEEMACNMAFRKGGVYGLEKALEAKTVNTVMLNSGVQISGVLTEYIANPEHIEFIKFTGPTQISFEDFELPDQGKEYHAVGFSSPIGMLKNFAQCPSELSDTQWETLGLELGKKLTINFQNGFVVEGIYCGRIIRKQKTLVMKFKEAHVTKSGKVFYQPDWGPFDLVLGSTVTSVYSGPADRFAYGQNDDFVVKKISTKQPSAIDLQIYQIYSDLRHLRTKFDFSSAVLPTLQSFFNKTQELDPNDWLVVLEIYEILISKKLILSRETGYEELLDEVRRNLESKKTFSVNNADSIEQGMQLAAHI
ncbi:MAG: aromatic amino acid hydroxylase [Bdellovibrionaceae bacterium]|nr:aromatic amino acid hydroxylase [Pseudobdellovibrionaceae bacterium]